MVQSIKKYKIHTGRMLIKPRNGPYKTTILKVFLKIQISGPYKTKMWSYIKDGFNCAT